MVFKGLDFLFLSIDGFRKFKIGRSNEITQVFIDVEAIFFYQNYNYDGRVKQT